MPDYFSLSTFHLLSVGGRYHLEIKIPETYPFNPPKVRLPGGSGSCAFLERVHLLVLAGPGLIDGVIDWTFVRSVILFLPAALLHICSVQQNYLF